MSTADLHPVLSQGHFQSVAPADKRVTAYDRNHLSLYAALVDADDAAISWREVAHSLMNLDPDHPDAEACWRSHLDRARWIISDGLANAVEAFGGKAL